MENFCLDLREHATKIINYGKKDMIPLTKKEEKKHNKQGSTYDCHFIIKELSEEFEGEFECLCENTEKYVTFSVPIKKEITKKDKDGNDKITKISYK